MNTELRRPRWSISERLLYPRLQRSPHQPTPANGSWAALAGVVDVLVELVYSIGFASMAPAKLASCREIGIVRQRCAWDIWVSAGVLASRLKPISLGG